MRVSGLAVSRGVLWGCRVRVKGLGLRVLGLRI